MVLRCTYPWQRTLSYVGLIVAFLVVEVGTHLCKNSTGQTTNFTAVPSVYVSAGCDREWGPYSEIGYAHYDTGTYISAGIGIGGTYFDSGFSIDQSVYEGPVGTFAETSVYYSLLSGFGISADAGLVAWDPSEMITHLAVFS